MAEPIAEEDGHPVFSALRTSPDAALEAFRAIMEHVDGSPPRADGVFAALQQFVMKGRKLVIALGNHDVELALPPVRRALLEALTGGSASRVELLLHGEAYVTGPLIAEHGNRCDGWNAVSHERLRALCSRMSRDNTYPAFEPQPGSRLVAEVMNPLKHRYRFIDLLKPETPAVIPLLAALEPAALAKLHVISRAAAQYMRAESVDFRRRRETSGYVSAFESLDGAPGAPDLPPDERETMQLLAEADSAWSVQREGLESGDGEVSTVGGWLAAASSLSRVLGERFDSVVNHARLTLLRKAFLMRRDALHATFDVSKEDLRYEDAAKDLAENRMRVVVFGHTHLPKSITLHERGHYLNAGTWCPTMSLDASWYDPQTPDDKALPELAAFLKDLSTNALSQRLRREAHCAVVEFDDASWARTGVTASLCGCNEQGKTEVLDQRVLSV